MPFNEYLATFPPGKYVIELSDAQERFYPIDIKRCHKMYDFSNVRRVHFNDRMVKPEIFTADAPLIPPLAFLVNMKLERLDDAKPITLVLEVITADLAPEFRLAEFIPPSLICLVDQYHNRDLGHFCYFDGLIRLKRECFLRDSGSA